ncbi:hypothetical protein Moror_10359 [Moniliophthora roreri MCA 2997]|uniref:DUF6534 domain-containing protein n=1 Tax=Moniliophthora roreri (strain MCA 2997) TaxID=1381753 RepID=V2WYN2_MONRO|nr:hypothetical protein Moror_10359 [Moniliophthora roreri MCA 2997]
MDRYSLVVPSQSFSSVFLLRRHIIQIHILEYLQGQGPVDKILSDALHCAFIIVFLYDAVIKHFDDATFLVTTNWVYSTEPAFSGMISSMVQTFFGWRVKLLTESWILLVIIQFCSAAVFLMGIADAIACNMVKFFTEFHKFKAVVIIWLVCAALADMIITVTLVIFLRRHKTGFKHTDSRIDRIIRCKFLLALASALAKPSSPSDRSDWPYYRHLCGDGSIVVPIIPHWSVRYSAHLIFNCVLPKLYTNSLLSSLNSRGRWRFNQTQDSHMKLSQDLRFFESHSENAIQLSVSRPEVLIHVESQETVDHTGRRDQSTSADENRV